MTDVRAANVTRDAKNMIVYFLFLTSHEILRLVNFSNARTPITEITVGAWPARGCRARAMYLRPANFV